MRSPLARGLAATVLALALSVVASSASAQSDPRLVDAVRAAQEGRGDSARTIVDRLLAATPPTDTLYPQILYTQAMVAGTAGDMRRLLQRVTVEYGTSSWADDALLRLVQMDYATRNFDGAARNLERLKLDFPATPLLPQAAYWAGRTYFDANNPTAACRWLADGMAQARNDVEVQNQLGYLYQRCDLRADTGAQAAAMDTARADSTGRVPPGAQAAATPPAGAPSPGAPSPGAPSPATPPVGAAPSPAPVPIQPPGAANAPPAAAPTPVSPPAPAAPAARTIYRVQIAAVATRKGAEDAARKARPLGLSVVTVQEKGLYKVRLGEYATREAAQNAAASLKARLGGSPFVVAGP
jgi:cell division septation protein DedD